MTLFEIKKEMDAFEKEVKESYNHNVIFLAEEKTKSIAYKYGINRGQAMFIVMAVINNILRDLEK